MLKYSTSLRNMQDHQNAITTNRKNYDSRLEIIASLSMDEDNLEFLQKFVNLTKQFKEQIEVDLRYLTPAQELFQQMIHTIRGIVEIEAEKHAQERDSEEKGRDRELQTTIAVVGVGVGVAGLAGTCYPYLLPQETTKIPLQGPSPSSSLHPFVLVMLWSIILGLLGAAIARIVTLAIPGVVKFFIRPKVTEEKQ